MLERISIDKEWNPIGDRGENHVREELTENSSIPFTRIFAHSCEVIVKSIGKTTKDVGIEVHCIQNVIPTRW